MKSPLFSYISITALALSFGIGSFVAYAASELRPNIEALPAEDVHLSVEGDATFLKFSTLSWNKGDGPIELVGGEVNTETGTQKVYQRVYLSDDSTYDRLVGEFVWHEDHDHVHFEGYATYTLQPLDAPGASERIGEKTSFCLMDTDRIDHKLPGAPKRAHYTTCSSDIQGISVGWGDKYGYQLPGQEIDVTGLPDGDYTLTIEVDPHGRLLETSTSENTSSVVIRIQDGEAFIVSDDGGSGGPGNGNGGGNGGGRPF